MGCHTANLPYMALDLRDPTAIQAETSGHNGDSYPKWSVIISATCARPSGLKAVPPGTTAGATPKEECHDRILCCMWGLAGIVCLAAMAVAADPPKTDDVSAVVEGNNQFALDLYAKLREGKADNLFFSPYSISTALAMTYAGARGETEKQMAEVLHFTVPSRSLHSAFASLMSELQSQTRTAISFALPIASGDNRATSSCPSFCESLGNSTKRNWPWRTLPRRPKRPERRSTLGSRSRPRRRSRT